MKTLTAYVVGACALLLLSTSAQAQVNLTTTTTSAAVTATQSFVILASATGVTARTTGLWFPATGEYTPVSAVNGTTITVQRGQGVGATAIASGATVVIVPNTATVGGTLYGACTGANARAFFQMLNPVQNVLYVCMLTGTWQGRQGTPIQLNHTLVITR